MNGVPKPVIIPDMPSRLKRWHTFGHDHFITFSCYERRPYLNDDRTCIVFLDYLETLRVRHHFEVYGYVLMPEHVHLLMSEPKGIELANLMRAFKTQTAKKLKGNRPHLWKERYYDFNVFTYDKFVEKLQYIHRNPVKRGLVKCPEDWPWSSYRHWLTGEPSCVEIESDWTLTTRERAVSNSFKLTHRDEWAKQQQAS